MSLGEWDDEDLDLDSDGYATGEVAGSAVFIDNTRAASGADVEEPPELYYGSVDEFVREQIVPVFRRRVGPGEGLHWAADWWRYPEAVMRLDALWRSWEALRLDPALGISVWMRDHADHHLAVLMSSDGPFLKSKDSNDHGEDLPYTAPPEGLFPDVRRGGDADR